MCVTTQWPTANCLRRLIILILIWEYILHKLCHKPCREEHLCPKLTNIISIAVLLSTSQSLVRLQCCDEFRYGCWTSQKVMCLSGEAAQQFFQDEVPSGGFIKRYFCWIAQWIWKLRLSCLDGEGSDWSKRLLNERLLPCCLFQWKDCKSLQRRGHSSSSNPKNCHPALTHTSHQQIYLDYILYLSFCHFEQERWLVWAASIKSNNSN